MDDYTHLLPIFLHAIPRGQYFLWYPKCLVQKI